MWQKYSEAQHIVIIPCPTAQVEWAQEYYRVEKAAGGESYVQSSLFSTIQVCIEVTDYLVCETLLWEDEQTGIKLGIFLQNWKVLLGLMLDPEDSSAQDNTWGY